MFTLPRIEEFAKRMNRRPGLWLTVFAGLLAMQISPLWYPEPDACMYLSVARSMATGESVTNFGRARMFVPPGYPVIISPAFLLGDRPFLALSVLQWGIAVVLMLGVYHWAQRQFPSVAVLITGLVMLNTAVWIHYRRTLKEIAFMAASMWAVNTLHALCRQSSALRTAVTAVSAGLLVLLSAMIRYPGVVLAAGFGVAMSCQAFRGRIGWVRAATLVFVVGAPAAAAVLANVRHEQQMAQKHGGDTYAQAFHHELNAPVSRFVEGLRLRISDIGRITIPGMLKSYARAGEWLNVNMLVYSVWLMILGVGWWHLVRRRFDVLALSLPFYIALYVIWTYDQGARFLTPMLPVLMACVWFGAGRLVTRRVLLLFTMLVAHLGVAVAYWIGVDAPRALEDHRRWPHVDQLAETIRTDLRPVAISNISRHTQMMLQLALDRQVRVCDDDREIPARFYWLVQPKHAPAHHEFEPQAIIGDYMLLSRQSADRRPYVSARNHPQPQRRGVARE